MILPRSCRTKSDVGMRARADVNVPGEAERHTACFGAGHGLDDAVRKSLARPVVDEQPTDPDQALCYPEAGSGGDPRVLWEGNSGRGNMNPCAGESHDGQDDVDVDKGLIESIPEHGQRQDQNDDHCREAHRARPDKEVGDDRLAGAVPSPVHNLHGRPRSGMNHNLENHGASDPPMHDVVGIEIDAEQADERVVSSREQNQRKQINCRQRPGPSPNLGVQRVLVFLIPREYKHICCVGQHEQRDEDGVQPGREGTKCHPRENRVLGAAQWLELLGVPGPP